MADKKQPSGKKSDKNDRAGTLTGTLVLAFSFAILGGAAVTLIGQTDEATAHAALTEIGVENVTITGKAGLFQCYGKAAKRTAFTGEINGKPVSGAVCKGWGSGVDIRFRVDAPQKP